MGEGGGRKGGNYWGSDVIGKGVAKELRREGDPGGWGVT
jgi:hypothetical protein